MIPEAKALYKRARNDSEDLYRLLLELREKAENVTDLDEMVDIHYVTTEVNSLLTNAAKEIRRLLNNVASRACVTWVHTQDMNCPTDTIKTEYVTSRPILTKSAPLPKKEKDPVEYEKFMRYLQVPEYLIQYPHEVIRIHWPGYVEFCTDVMERGFTLPDGLDPNRTHTTYDLKIHSKRPILPDGE